MNELSSEVSWDDDRWLDRLVDGELSPRERQTLLLALDANPDGWRRCALAFLEAQSWRRELPAIVQSAQRMPSVSPAPPRSTWQRSAVVVLVMAASFMLAFALGGVWQRALQPRIVRPEKVEEPSLPVSAPELVQASKRESQQPLPTAPVSTATSSSAHEQVTLLVDGGTGSAAQSIDVPLVEAKSAPADWQGVERQSALEPLLERLEQLGHRVERQQRFAPVQLPDGRQFVVPVEDVEIVPVGRVVY